ncbi:MAG: hypothetical protein K1X74_13025 [Pirellulales bacterium]|nr:hypothetical protein [Pirellulales bacterium]
MYRRICPAGPRAKQSVKVPPTSIQNSQLLIVAGYYRAGLVRSSGIGRGALEHGDVRILRRAPTGQGAWPEGRAADQALIQ